jgi:hypothetical protein
LPEQTPEANTHLDMAALQQSQSIGHAVNRTDYAEGHRSSEEEAQAGDQVQVQGPHCQHTGNPWLN